MDDIQRYHRQMLLADFGETAQRRLLGSRALLVGCGALGSVIAESLVRAGVGRLRVVDRDVVDLTNLHRQTLFDETDARDGIPKSVAAAQKLAAINTQVTVEPMVADFNAANADELATGCDLLLDGTDNFEARYLLNDLAVQRGLPYVYGGAVGMSGAVAVTLPRTPDGATAWEQADVVGPCLRCLFDQAPPPGVTPTCDTVGVLGPVAWLVASYQAVEAIKLLAGMWDKVSRDLLTIDLGSNTHHRLKLAAARDPQCVCCGQRRFDHLEGDAGSATVKLCGRNAVQVMPTRRPQHSIDLAQLEPRLAAHGAVRQNEFMLRADLRDAGHDYRITLFTDGRALVQGTEDPTAARAIYARYIGL